MTSPAEMSSSLNDAFILVVEDDPDDAALIEALLYVSLIHAKIHRVVSASEARSYLAGQGPYKERHRFPLPSLILLDLGLPGRSGFEVLAWLAERDEFSSIPVIVVTASEDSVHAQRAYELGVRRFMRKADDYAELAEAVKVELHR